jgi:putative phage-type endonuclease
MIEHGTPEWEKARLGKLTASRIYDALGTTKKGTWLAARRHYMVELIAERLTGMRADPYLSAPMLWGVETEPQAIKHYTNKRVVTVTKSGFVNHPLLTMSGASPDGFVGDDGLIEVKCPETATHVATLVEKEIPEKYLLQMHWQMACCPPRKWCDYLSFDPRMPPKFRAAVIRVPRDQKKITGLTIMVEDFLDEIDAIIMALEGGMDRTPEWKMAAAHTVLEVVAEHVGSEDIAKTLKPTRLLRPK